MQKVDGIGGIFFRAKDPAKLAAWYLEHLGINLVPTDADTLPWMQSPGPTVFSPFADDTDYFPADRQFMINFRVSNLDAMLSQLEAAGISISHRESMEGVGQFARIHDPEGYPVELWQPA